MPDTSTPRLSPLRTAMASTPVIVVTQHADGRETATPARIVHSPQAAPEPVASGRCLRDCCVEAS